MADLDPAGPSIVLIGGAITLDSGATVDSRRPLEGDEWDFTLRAAVGGSEAFWRKAKTLSDIILDEDDSSAAWALAWVGKTIKRPKADGTFTRVRTVKYLDDADHLLDRLREGGNAQIDAETVGARYRINPYYLRFADIKTSTDPAVFVGAFHTTYEDGTDIVGLAPLQYVLSRWPKATLILPHTPLIEQKTRDIVDWYRSGARPPRLDQSGWVEAATYESPSDSASFGAAYEATADIRAADPYIVDDDLGITFWVDRGQFREAADLDAALTFVLSRYDLEVGLWDLARDPILRRTLLDPDQQEPVPTTPAAIPRELADAVAEQAADRRAGKQAEKDARESLHRLLWPRLKPLGWYVPSWKDHGTEYRFGVGPEVESPYESVEKEPAVFFDLMIHKKQATLNLFAVTRIEATENFLAANSNDIETLTGQRPEPSTNTLLRFQHGGWDGPHEQWQQDLEKVLSCIDVLVPRLGTVIEAAVEFREQQLADWAPTEITVTVDVGPPPPERKPKRGFFRRLLGGD